MGYVPPTPPAGSQVGSPFASVAPTNTQGATYQPIGYGGSVSAAVNAGIAATSSTSVGTGQNLYWFPGNYNCTTPLVVNTGGGLTAFQWIGPGIEQIAINASTGLNEQDLLAFTGITGSTKCKHWAMTKLAFYSNNQSVNNVVNFNLVAASQGACSGSNVSFCAFNCSVVYSGNLAAHGSACDWSGNYSFYMQRIEYFGTPSTLPDSIFPINWGTNSGGGAPNWTAITNAFTVVCNTPGSDIKMDAVTFGVAGSQAQIANGLLSYGSTMFTNCLTVGMVNCDPSGTWYLEAAAVGRAKNQKIVLHGGYWSNSNANGLPLGAPIFKNYCGTGCQNGAVNYYYNGTTFGTGLPVTISAKGTSFEESGAAQAPNPGTFGGTTPFIWDVICGGSSTWLKTEGCRFAATDSSTCEIFSAPWDSLSLAAAITTTGQTAITVSSGAVPQGVTVSYLIDAEIVLVTAAAGTAYTITRGQSGTAAATHVINSIMLPITQQLNTASQLGSYYYPIGTSDDYRQCGVIVNGVPYCQFTLAGGGLTAGATAMTTSAVGSTAGLVIGTYFYIDQEQVKVTAGDGTTAWTIVRAQNGTSAAAHASGAFVTAASGMLYKNSGIYKLTGDNATGTFVFPHGLSYPGAGTQPAAWYDLQPNSAGMLVNGTTEVAPYIRQATANTGQLRFVFQTTTTAGDPRSALRSQQHDPHLLGLDGPRMNPEDPCGRVGCGHSRRSHHGPQGWCETCGVDSVRGSDPPEMRPAKCDLFLEDEQTPASFVPGEEPFDALRGHVLP